MTLWRPLAAALAACLLCVATRAADIRLYDNTRLNAMIEEVSVGEDVSLRVTLMDGRTRTIPLSDIITINFHGRSPRMLLTGTQEVRFISGDRLRGRFVANLGVGLLRETNSLGRFHAPLATLKGFVTMPRTGRAGRWADEMVEEPSRSGASRFLDEVIDRRGSPYQGVIRRFSTSGIEIDHDSMLKVVSLPTIYLAGGRLADATRNPVPAASSDVLLRVHTRDGSRIDGRIESIALDRWVLKARWDPKTRLPVREKEIVSIQVLNSRRLYLSQLVPIRVTEKTVLAPPQPYRMDRNCQGGALTIADRSYPWGIGVHANSELMFRLAGAFKTFQTIPGIDGGSRGSVIFSVIGDGKVLYRSGVVRADNKAPKEISVSVEGVEELTLKVEHAGDLDLGDVANWAAAQLLR